MCTPRPAAIEGAVKEFLSGRTQPRRQRSLGPVPRRPKAVVRRRPKARASTARRPRSRSRRSRSRQALRRRRPRAGARNSAKQRPMRRLARSAAASRSSTRRRLPLGRPLRRNRPLRTRRQTPALPLQGRRRRTPYRLQDGRGDGRARRLPLLRGAGDPAAGEDPPILDNPSVTEENPRPRIQDLRRQRADQTDRLAPWSEHRLDRQRSSNSRWATNRWSGWPAPRMSWCRRKSRSRRGGKP